MSPLSKFQKRHRLPGPGQEFFEVAEGYAVRGCVDIRMKVDRLVFSEVVIDDHANFLRCVVDEPERRYGTRFYAQKTHEPLGRSKAEPVLDEFRSQRFEVNRLCGLGDNQVVPVSLIIAEKEVFTVGSDETPPVFFGLFDGEDGGMLVPGERDAELLDDVFDFFFLVGHCKKRILDFFAFFKDFPIGVEFL